MSFHVRSGPWTPSQIEAWLIETVVPLRLASAGKRGPLVQSLWFNYEDGALWCATQRDSVLAKRVRRDGNVGWEVSRDEPPYRGVRGTGTARIVDEIEHSTQVLERLVARYGQAGTQLAHWLLGRIATEVVVRIDDLRVTSWDYAPRM
jgi:nitroimidazol reductase NimA-like FMN-containing flavoprotein (pyridoxamine 5'-phosphate oxidase superfamily)